MSFVIILCYNIVVVVDVRKGKKWGIVEFIVDVLCWCGVWCYVCL